MQAGDDLNLDQDGDEEMWKHLRKFQKLESKHQKKKLDVEMVGLGRE